MVSCWGISLWSWDPTTYKLLEHLIMGIFLHGAAYSMLHSISNSWEFNYITCWSWYNSRFGLIVLSIFPSYVTSTHTTPHLEYPPLTSLGTLFGTGFRSLNDLAPSCPVEFTFSPLFSRSPGGSLKAFLSLKCTVHSCLDHCSLHGAWLIPPPPPYKGFTLASTSLIILFTLVSPPSQATNSSACFDAIKALITPRNSFIFSLWTVIH